MIQVFVVDDHDLLRDGLAILIGAQPDFELAGAARSGEEAVAAVVATPPDLLLMDLNLPGMSGVEAIREIRKALPSLPILVLTSFTEPQTLSDARDAGATSVVLKAIDKDDLVNTMRMTSRGMSIVTPEALRVDALPRCAAVTESLTERERDVIVLVARGMTNAQVGRELCLQLSTVKNHISRIMEKLAVGSRTEAAVVWLRDHPDPKV